MPYDASIIKLFNSEIQGLPGNYWLESLRDGTPVLIRELVDTDRDRDLTFFNNLGRDAPHFRFLGSFSDLAPTHDQLMDVDQCNRMSYIALLFEGDQLTEVGVARYGSFKGDSHCEFAVAVCERWQRRGLASSLLKHLMDTAREQGFISISSMDSSGNQAMHGLATIMGFTSRVDDNHGPRVFHEYLLAD